MQSTNSFDKVYAEHNGLSVLQHPGLVSTRPLFAEIHNRGKGRGAVGFQMASQLCAATSVITSKTSMSEIPPRRFKKRQNKFNLFTNNHGNALNS